MLLQFCVGTSNGLVACQQWIGGAGNNVVNIKVLLSVSSVLLPFLMPDNCRGEFLCFSSIPKKMDRQDSLLL